MEFTIPYDSPQESLEVVGVKEPFTDMRFAAVICSKNNQDIIESFVRVNGRFIDSFLFYDESTDSTRTILANLVQEGFEIHFFDGHNRPYDQGRIVTELTNIAFKADKISADFVFILDTDEFPMLSTRQQLERIFCQLEGNRPLKYFWQTYVCIDPNLFHQANFLKVGFKQRIPEGAVISKVVIPKALAGKFYIDNGSHTAYRLDGASHDFQLLPFSLGHFPVRTVEQIILKNAEAVDMMIRKSYRRPGEGFHIYDVLNQIIDDSLPFSELILTAGMEYACEKNPLQTVGELPTWIDDYSLKYTKTDSFTHFSCRRLMQLLCKSWANPIDSSQAKYFYDSVGST
jgi:hypothetical protein